LFLAQQRSIWFNRRYCCLFAAAFTAHIIAWAQHVKAVLLPGVQKAVHSQT